MTEPDLKQKSSECRVWKTASIDAVPLDRLMCLGPAHPACFGPSSTELQALGQASRLHRHQDRNCGYWWAARRGARVKQQHVQVGGHVWVCPTNIRQATRLEHQILSSEACKLCNPRALGVRRAALQTCFLRPQAAEPKHQMHRHPQLKRAQDLGCQASDTLANLGGLQAHFACAECSRCMCLAAFTRRACDGASMLAKEHICRRLKLQLFLGGAGGTFWLQLQKGSRPLAYSLQPVHTTEHSHVASAAIGRPQLRSSQVSKRAESRDGSWQWRNSMQTARHHPGASRYLALKTGFHED